jgi:hypothetical protein
MKIIQLTKGLSTIVDDEDHEYLNQWKWYCSKDGYVRRSEHHWTPGGKDKVITIRMHRQILGIKNPYIQSDHINHNRLDNRKSNLRICTNNENCKNASKHRDAKSKFIGVIWYKNKWIARVRCNYIEVYRKVFNNEIEAALARDGAAKLYHGEFANLNFP